jgi:4-hydroxy-3-polyprenylbenzoate decarboxylase
MEREFFIGVTGASGIIYARRLLEVLCESAMVHLVVTDTAGAIARHEGVSFEGLSATVHRDQDLGAPFSSGSRRYDGMAIVPCSMKTLAAVSGGYSETLITRAADVCLKERRPCLLVLREMPLSRIHLTNMLAAHDAGATVMVASPGFYHRPKEIRDLVDMVVARVLDHLGVSHDLDVRWRGYHA